MEHPRIDQTLDRPLSVQDQQLFDRVWQRVMAERGSTPPPPQDTPPPTPSTPLPAPPDPVPNDPPCLGRASMEFAGLLGEMSESALGAWQVYQGLSRRTQGPPSRHLRALAADQQQSHRQLATVYFLLTGEHVPSLPHTTPPSGPLDGLLREMFLRESRWQRAFEQAAAQPEDPCLRQLFAQLAQRAGDHMDAIRRVLEGL